MQVERIFRKFLQEPIFSNQPKTWRHRLDDLHLATWPWWLGLGDLDLVIWTWRPGFGNLDFGDLDWTVDDANSFSIIATFDLWHVWWRNSFVAECWFDMESSKTWSIDKICVRCCLIVILRTMDGIVYNVWLLSLEQWMALSIMSDWSLEQWMALSRMSDCYPQNNGWHWLQCCSECLHDCLRHRIQMHSRLWPSRLLSRREVRVWCQLERCQLPASSVSWHQLFWKWWLQPRCQVSWC